jgi:hypothetical protein
MYLNLLEIVEVGADPHGYPGGGVALVQLVVCVDRHVLHHSPSSQHKSLNQCCGAEIIFCSAQAPNKFAKPGQKPFLTLTFLQGLMHFVPKKD